MEQLCFHYLRCYVALKIHSQVILKNASVQHLWNCNFLRSKFANLSSQLFAALNWNPH